MEEYSSQAVSQASPQQTLVSPVSETIQELQHQLQRFFCREKQQRLRCILPSIETLQQQIQALQLELSQHPSQVQLESQRNRLTTLKTQLMTTINSHNTAIQSCRQETYQIKIFIGQLDCELADSAQPRCHTLPNNLSVCKLPTLHRSSQQSTIKDKQNSDLAPNSSRVKRISRLSIESSKWKKIDDLIQELQKYPSTAIAEAMLRLSKREHKDIKAVFKDFKVSHHIENLLKNQAIRKGMHSLKQFYATESQ